ncbi:hypothetical protein QA995_14940 [Streptomyces scabiei]|uniref:hypothetical protein n=1 Tax=Streptomyces scabiei TaxID=1930 RepID=UPI000765D5A2|nr:MULTISPECIES: hypothetical protein [Streptomyces]QTU45611.1 hypothetical protein F3K20_12715 [Streptomyces sp. LBUM 1482]
MTGRQRRRAPPKAEPEYVPGQLLDWRSSAHWSYEERPCRYCGFDTNLRDSKGSPAHKVCAEDALAALARDAAAAYRVRSH